MGSNKGRNKRNRNKQNRREHKDRYQEKTPARRTYHPSPVKPEPLVATSTKAQQRKERKEKRQRRGSANVMRIANEVFGGVYYCVGDHYVQDTEEFVEKPWRILSGSKEKKT